MPDKPDVFERAGITDPNHKKRILDFWKQCLLAGSHLSLSSLVALCAPYKTAEEIAQLNIELEEIEPDA